MEALRRSRESNISAGVLHRDTYTSLQGGTQLLDYLRDENNLAGSTSHSHAIISPPPISSSQVSISPVATSKHPNPITFEKKVELKTPPSGSLPVSDSYSNLEELVEQLLQKEGKKQSKKKWTKKKVAKPKVLPITDESSNVSEPNIITTSEQSIKGLLDEHFSSVSAVPMIPPPASETTPSEKKTLQKDSAKKSSASSERKGSAKSNKPVEPPPRMKPAVKKKPKLSSIGGVATAKSQANSGANDISSSPIFSSQRQSRYSMYYEDVKTTRSPSISPDIYTSGSHHSFYRTTSISQVTSYSRSHSRSRSMSPGFSESHHSLYRTSSSTTIHNSDIRMNSGTRPIALSRPKISPDGISPDASHSHAIISPPPISSSQRQSRYSMYYEDVKTTRSPSISPDIYTSGSHHSFYRTTSISQVTSYSRSHSRSRSMSPGFSESHHSLYRTSSSSQITTIHNNDIKMNSGTRPIALRRPKISPDGISPDASHSHAIISPPPISSSQVSISPVDQVALLLKEIKNASNPDLRTTALQTIFSLARAYENNNWKDHITEALTVFIDCLQDTDGLVRTMALRVLRELIKARPPGITQFTEQLTKQSLETFKDTDCNVSQAAEDLFSPLAGALPPQRVLDILTPMVSQGADTSSLGALKLISKVVSHADESIINSKLNELVPGIVQGYCDEESSVRKASVFCLVEIHGVVGEKLRPHLSALSSSQSRLLDLYIRRHHSAPKNDSAKKSSASSERKGPAKSNKPVEPPPQKKPSAKKKPKLSSIGGVAAAAKSQAKPGANDISSSPIFSSQRQSRYSMYYEDVKKTQSPSISPDIYTSGSHHSFCRTTSTSQVISYSRSHSRSRSMSPGFSESHHSLYRTSSSSQITIHNNDIRMNSGTRPIALRQPKISPDGISPDTSHSRASISPPPISSSQVSISPVATSKHPNPITINKFKEKVEFKAPPPGSMPEAKPEPAPPKDDKAAPSKKKPVLSSQKKPLKKKVVAGGDDDVSGEGGGDKPAEPPPRKKPVSEKKPIPAKSAGAGGVATAKSKAKPGAIGKTDEPPDVPEPNITDEEVDEKASEVLPSGLLDQLAHSNWKERLAGHEQFKEFVESLPPDQMQSLLFGKVLARKPGWKDSNFQIMKAKFQVVTVLAEKSTTFGKKTTACVVPALVDKFADIRVKGQCSETLLMIAEKMTLNYTSLQVMKNAFEHRSPKVQSESLDWLSQGLKEFGFLLNVKPHVDYIKKAFAATNPAVRTAAINLLATMHMYLGAQLRMFFEEEKAALLQQIDAAFEKSAGETPPPPTRGPNVRSGEEEAEEGGEGESEASGSGAALSLADLMPKVDISAQIKPEIIKELNDKNWKIRGEALQKVKDIVTQAKFIQPSLGELPGALKARLGDSNKNLVIITLNIIARLGVAMGSSCSKFNKVLLPSVLTTLANSKPQVRNAGVACLNGWVAEVSFASLVEQDLLAPALANENPNLRYELLGWFEEKLPDIGKLPSEVQSLVPSLFACLEDRSADVRKKAQIVLPLLMVPVGYDVMLKYTGKLKPASKQIVKALLDKHRPSVSPVPTKPSATSETAPSEKKTTPQKGSAKKRSASVKGKATAKSCPKTTGGKEAEEDDESSVLTLIPHGKEQRMKDEEKLKILKWNFQFPHPEHIDQLKDQLLSCVSLSIHKKLFHEDFKQHLAAVATLTEAINKDVDTTIGCFDLLLRWVTLRFFDTNTTVIMKCLEFLHTLFLVLTTAGYKMSEYEAGAFLPYLVIKVGDPKDPVRRAVRNLFRDICNFYPPGKLFVYIIDGLKSKNARQRTECLELLGELIQNNGMIICQPSPQETLPLIAAQITDRDNAVRSAALNTMVVVYSNVGEGVYKFTSQLSEKEVCLFEECIRRSGKVFQQQHQPAKSNIPSTSEPEISEAIVEKPPSPVLVAKTTSPKGSSLPKFTGPFSLDMKKYSTPPRSHLIRPRVSRPDLSGLEGDIKMPSYTTSKLVGNPPKPLSISPARMTTTSSAISYIISQITSSDIEVSSKALAQIEGIATSSEQQSILATHIDQLLRAILMQKRINFTTHLSMATSPEDYQRVLNMSRTLAGVLIKVFCEVSLAKKVRQETLVELERDIFGYLLDDQLYCLENIAQLNRVYNVLMGQVVKNTDKNAIFGSLLQVMLETLGPDGSSTKLSDLAMKCLWRLTRQLQDILSVLNVDQLLGDLDVFFAGYATLNPTPSPNDKPYRTVKTILYHLANIMRSEVLDHFSLIKDPMSSQVVQYLHETIKKQSISSNKSETKKSIDIATPSSTTIQVNPLEQSTLPADVASHFTSIMETIKNPSTTQQGFEELYDFREAHPEIYVKGCFSSTSHFFQAYIERNLNKVPQWRQSTLPQRVESEDFEKIRKGLENVRLRASQVVTNWDQHNPQTQIFNPEPHKHKGPPPSTNQISLKLDDLRKRLDKLKRAQ